MQSSCRVDTAASTDEVPLGGTNERIPPVNCSWISINGFHCNVTVVMLTVRHVMDQLKITACHVRRSIWCHIRIYASGTLPVPLVNSENLDLETVRIAISPASLVVERAKWSALLARRGEFGFNYHDNMVRT